MEAHAQPTGASVDGKRHLPDLTLRQVLNLSSPAGGTSSSSRNESTIANFVLAGCHRQ